MIRLYFYGPATSNRTLIQAYETVKDICHRSGVELSTNTGGSEINLPSETIAAHEATATPLLDAMQAIIVEGSTTDPQTGYLLAYAFAEKRPLLYLYTRGESAPEVLRFMKMKDLPKHIMVATYTTESIERVVRTFLEQLGNIKVREIPRLKFTLRLTSAMDEYLDFKTRNTKVTKADFLREKIDRLIEEDTDFQQYRRKRRE